MRVVLHGRDIRCQLLADMFGVVTSNGRTTLNMEVELKLANPVSVIESVKCEGFDTRGRNFSFFEQRQVDQRGVAALLDLLGLKDQRVLSLTLQFKAGEFLAITVEGHASFDQEGSDEKFHLMQRLYKAVPEEVSDVVPRISP